jgi:dTDP-4-dehydrorhamnose reductase
MITLIGHGYVGNYINTELFNSGLKYKWIHRDEDIPQGTEFIINAAGYTGVPNVDACESARDQTIKGNVLFPLDLENRSEVPVLHISSGCVYTGYTDGGWLEEDVPNFTFDNASFYSASKSLFQELWMQQWYYRSYIFRIRMPFGPDTNDKNLLMKLGKYPKLVNHLNSISYLPDVAAAAVYFARFRPTPGIYNAVNPQAMKIGDIAMFLNRPMEFLDEKEAKKAMKAPRSNCVLNSDKMQSIYRFKDSTQALRESVNYIFYDL